MITILYTCEECGLRDRSVQCPARTTEDVRVWVGKIVAGCVGADHRKASPGCRAVKMTMLKIPMPPEADFIGQQIE